MGLAPRLLLAFWMLAASACGLAADELAAIPPLKSRVIDLTGTLSRQEAVALETEMAKFEQHRGSQIAILMVPATAARRERPRARH